MLKKEKKQKKLKTKKKKEGRLKRLKRENEDELKDDGDYDYSSDSESSLSDSDSDSLLGNLNPSKRKSVIMSSNKKTKTEKKEGFSLRELGNDGDVSLKSDSEMIDEDS